MQPVAVGCIIAESIAVLLMQCPLFLGFRGFELSKV